MAYRIYSPEFSFVQFAPLYYPDNSWLDNQTAGNELIFCLPVSGNNDLHFAVYVEATTPAEQAVLCGLDPKTACMIHYLSGINSGPITNPVILNVLPKWPNATNISNGQYVQRTRLSDTLFMFYWTFPMHGFTETAYIDTCFQFIFRIEIAPRLLSISNCMVFTLDDGYSSTIEYRSQLNEFGFYYDRANDFTNKVRLRIYPGQEQYSVDESVYVKSDGDRKVTKSLIYTRFPFNVDYMPAWAHKNLLLALKHDDITVSHKRYTGKIRMDGDYNKEEIKNLDYPLAPGSFAAFQIPVVQMKNICGEKTFEYFPIGTSYGVVYDRCGTHTWDLTPAIPAAAICDGPAILKIGNINTTYVDTAVVVGNTVQVHLKDAASGSPVFLFTIEVVRPASTGDIIGVVGTFSGINHC